MKHSIIYKNKNEYSSFPLIEKCIEKNNLYISFFTAPIPDHAGLFNWKTLQSCNQGEGWWPSYIDRLTSKMNISPREISDRFEYESNGQLMTTGSYGFKISKNQKTVLKSKGLFIRTFDHDYKLINQRIYGFPRADIVLTFPRPLAPRMELDPIRLIPAYVVLKNGMNRALAWRSEDFGRSWRVYNMFSYETNINEMAFVWANDENILAHLRSDQHPFLMESWSEDSGKTWTYPTSICIDDNIVRSNVIGGPPHLLRLSNGKILCTYGYRRNEMGIRAIVSNNGGDTWNKFIVLRNDGGYLSSLHKRKWRNKFKLPHPGNDVGYPVSIQLDNDDILTVYYITCEDQITHIAATKWDVEKPS